MKVVTKVCACVIREFEGGRELLVFEHPMAGVQIPKGGLEPGEDPVDGVVRELHEETGLTGIPVSQSLGVWQRQTGGGPNETGPPERHDWHVFLLASPPGLPDEWLHEAWGSAEEDGFAFRCHWIPLDADTGGRLHPLFTPVVDLLLAAELTD